MILIVGKNSWITISECDTYLTNRIGSENWFDLLDRGDPGALSKTSLIMSAFYWLMGTSNLELSADLTDELIKNAQAESALFLLDHYDELDARRSAMFTGVEEFTISKRSERLNIHNLAIPPHIMGLLESYTVNNCIVEFGGQYDT